MGALAFLTLAMQLAPLIIQLGEDVAPFAEWVWQVISNSHHVTAADLQELKNREADLRSRLNAPKPGDPVPA